MKSLLSYIFQGAFKAGARTLLGVSLFCLSVVTSAATLTVNLSNVKSDKGTLQIRVADRALYESDSNDPGKISKDSKPQKGKNTVVIKNVPPGEYVVQALHDLNGNSEMDYNFIGLPKEFWGISTNPKVRMDKQLWDFDKIKILVAEKDLTIDIRMRKIR